jgi:hypothetical protein
LSARQNPGFVSRLRVARVVNGGTVMTRDIKSAGLAPFFASDSLQNSPRIQLVGNNFCVRESISSIEPTVFTGFFFFS